MVKRKLLIVTDSFLPRWDGVARFLDDFLPGLDKEFEVKVIAPKYRGKEPEYNGVDVNYIQTYDFTISDYSPPKPARTKIKELIEWCDLVFVQTIGLLGGYAILQGRKNKKKVIAYTHSLEWELVSKSISRNILLKKAISKVALDYARYFYRRCDLLIIPGQEFAKKLDEKDIDVPTKVATLGTNINHFKPTKNKSNAKKKLGIDSSKIVIGTVGRIGKEKDLGTLKKAFELVSKKRQDIILMIVGSGNPDEEKKLSGEGIIKPGRLDDVVPYLQAMDIFALPSLTETSSLSTMEAMATGLPCIVTPVGHIPKYVEHGKNGIMFGRGNVEALAVKIEKLICAEDRRAQMGELARESIVKNYSVDKTRKRIIDILKQE